jgi:hypothetical protein
MAVVWPILLFVPGWVLAARVAPDLSPPGRGGLAVVSSIYLSSHLVNVLALAGGFGRAAILASTGLLLALTWVLAAAPLRGLAPPPPLDFSAAWAALARDRVAWATAGAGAGIVGGILALSAWHRTPDGWVSGGWNWSDFLVHVSIAASILHGNFPPQVPYFSGEPLTYHWFADFQAAIVAAAGGIPVIPAMLFANAVMAGVLALLVWELARLLTGDRQAAALAALLGLFGGGMGYIRLALDVAAGRGGALALVSQQSYDNTWLTPWPYFRIASVLGTGFLAHRATALGLPALVGVILLVHVSWGRRPAGVALAGLLAALLAPFHFYAFPAVYLIVFLHFIALRGWQTPGWPRDAALFLGPLVLALPFVVPAGLQQHARGAVRLVLGWPDAPWRDGVPAVAFFYATNLGVPFLLALVAATRRLPHRGFLVSWLLALFLLPNLVVATAVTFDMNKYFQMMWLAAAILAAWLIRRWPRPLVAAVLLASFLSPALVGVWHLTSRPVALTQAQERAARWIEQHTPERAVFVTDAFINSPVDLAGRLRLTTYGPYVANLGYDPAPREADVHRVYCDGDDQAAAIMQRYRAGYVLSTGGLLDCGQGRATDFAASPRFETVYRDGGVSVWRLRGAS